MAKWKAPNNPTKQARQVWAALFPGQAWPKGWKVSWAGFMRGVRGLTIYDRKLVLLNYADARKDKDPVETLIHEFVHVRCGHRLRHGKEFLGLENSLRGKLGFEPFTSHRPADNVVEPQ